MKVSERKGKMKEREERVKGPPPLHTHLFALYP